eukprot:SAG11_NODE_3259_length_2573_cov_1.385206_1_plen_186_part_00
MVQHRYAAVCDFLDDINRRPFVRLCRCVGEGSYWPTAGDELRCGPPSRAPPPPSEPARARAAERENCAHAHGRLGTTAFSTYDLDARVLPTRPGNRFVVGVGSDAELLPVELQVVLSRPSHAEWDHVTYSNWSSSAEPISAKEWEVPDACYAMGGGWRGGLRALSRAAKAPAASAGLLPWHNTGK